MRLEMSNSEAETLADSLRELRHQIDLMELEWAVGAARLAGSGYHEEIGWQKPSDFLRHHCRMGEGAVKDRLAVARSCGQLARSGAALIEGEIGFAHLVVLAHTVGSLRGGPGEVAFDEQQLLDKAREQTMGRFWHTCQNYLHACDPDEFGNQVEDLHEQRELTIRRRRDGMSTLWGRLDPLTAASLREALAPLAKRQGKDDGRSFKQRLHDAVGERLGASAPAHVNVTMTAETLLALKGAPAGEIEGQAPLGQATLERLTCDCTVRRVVFDSPSVVIDVGRRQRVVSAPARKALEARDRGCVWPGCGRPGSWCSPHHLLHWARGGRNDLPNQVLLCYFHHRCVHEGGWEIFREADGRISVLRPPPSFGPWPRGPSLARTA